MLFSQIRPFIRYARYLHLNQTTLYDPHIPYDARLFYVMEGSGRIDVYTDSLCITYILNKGDVLLINSGIEYHLITPKNRVSYLALNFDYTFAHAALSIPVQPKPKASFQKEQVIEHVNFDDLQELNHTAYIKGVFEIERNLISIEEEYSHRVIYSDIKISSLLSETLIDLSRKLKFAPVSDNETKGKNMNPRVIIDYIYENYDKPLTNTDIGLLFGYHPNYISSLIKLYTGLPLHQYLMHIRIVRATNYLDMGTMSVGEIAKICGFGSLNYFSRYFKKFTGISPTEYGRQ